MLGMNVFANGVISRSCDSEYQLKRMNFLATIPPAVVVLHSRFPLYLNGRGFDNTIGGVEFKDEIVMARTPHSSLDERFAQHKEALEKTINELLKLKHQVIIISGVPTNGWNPIKRLKRLENFALADTHEARLRRMQIPLLSVNSELDLSDRIIRETIQRYPYVRLIDPKTIFCDSSYCSSISKNKILYTDQDHLSFEGTMKVFNRLSLELGLNEDLR